ncbi:MAG: hypothetical protein ACRENX_08680 [Candidatus Dormibacteria bacterium]
MDPGHLWEGTGKNPRPGKFRRTEELIRPGLPELVAEAIKFDRATG